MPGVVCVGSATLDTVALVDAYPGPDERVLARQLVRAGGGNAATAAVAIARLGLAVSFVGTVGADDEGDQVRDGLAAEGVDVAGLRPDARVATGASVIVCASATRAICTRPVPPLRLGAEAKDLVRQASWVHVDYLGWPVVQDLVADLPPAERPRLSVDDGNPAPAGRPDEADLYAPSATRLRARYGDLPAEKALRRCGAGEAVVTFGADGSLGRDAAGALVRVPGHRIEVTSTLGAGDVFHGALVAAAPAACPCPRR